MDGHPECIVTENLTTGIHQAQSVNAEIGAEPGHTSDVQRPGRLDEDNDDGQLSLCRWLSRSAIDAGSIWKLGIGGVSPLTI